MMDSPRQGLERPIQIYRVIRPSGVRGRFQAAIAAGGLTSFVGREDELRSLMNRWESMNARAPPGSSSSINAVEPRGPR
jgi:hypothetical protein